jgi:hypothetical protein
MDTIAQQQTKAILQLKKDYDDAIRDRDLWRAEAERWRKTASYGQPLGSEMINDSQPII